MSENQDTAGRSSNTRRAFLGLAAAGAGAVAVTAGTTVPAYLRTPAAPLPATAAAGRYSGKVVVLTGGTSGIGEAAVREFAAEGAAVVFCGRREDLGRAVAGSLPGAAHFVRADVREPDDVAALFAEVDRRFGRLDVAVANAGITRTAPAAELALADFDDVLGTNLRGAFLTVKHAVPLLLRSGGGAILCTASESRRPGGAAYSASKLGLQGLVAAVAQDYGTRGIRVNAIAPGTTDTAFVRPPGLPDAVWNQFRDAWGPLNVSGLARMATPREIARAMVALCSDDFGYLAGSTVLVGGGPLGGGAMRMPPGVPG
ncbi:SDR family NAD(P)-dependent oxidoreductase [Nocardia sp. NPDC057227]|uniref:SDR family NAD(P)-dependent oxidoreductase n=1 Tax=Nocardia sp. NPDC057227 TaxID=3346056 RepID=UPI00362924E2